MQFLNDHKNHLYYSVPFSFSVLCNPIKMQRYITKWFHVCNVITLLHSCYILLLFVWVHIWQYWVICLLMLSNICRLARRSIVTLLFIWSSIMASFDEVLEWYVLWEIFLFLSLGLIIFFWLHNLLFTNLVHNIMYFNCSLLCLDFILVKDFFFYNKSSYI